MSMSSDPPHADEDKRAARLVGPGSQPPHDRTERIVGFGWVEGGLIFLTTGQLFSGAWALFSPAGFYEDYPG